MHRPLRHHLLRAAGCALLAACAPYAAGQAYPTRTIHVLVGFPVGGAADVIGRIVAPHLANAWGQPVVVDNRPGAGGNLAAELTANAKPDGYTLLMIATSHATNAGLSGKLPFDPANSFAAVAMMASVPQVLVVGNNLPAKSVTELIALAKARPGKLNFGSGGTGSATHLVGELFKSMAAVDIVHVPYKGVSFAVTDIMGGQLEMAFSSLPAALTQIRGNRVRALGVTSVRRSPFLPDTPTIAEAGVAGYEATGWSGMLAPAGTPADIVNKLNTAINAALKVPEVIADLGKQGAEPEGGSAAEFDRYLRKEITKWTKVIRDAKIE